MRIIDKNRNMWINLINNQNIMFVISLPYGKKSKNRKGELIFFDECWKQIFFYEPLIHREYSLFSQNSESSLEQ